MTATSFSSVTLATITNYRNAAQQATRAYQRGGLRLIAAVNSAIDNQVYSRTAKFAPKLTEGVSQVRGRVSDAIVKGIDGIGNGTTTAVTYGSDAAAKQVNKAANRLAGVDNSNAVAKGLKMAARWSLPGANLALAVSDMVASGAETLADVAAGKAAPATAASPVARRAKPRVARASKVVEVVKAVKPVTPVAKKLRKAAEPAVTVVKKAAVHTKRKTASVVAPAVQA